MLIRPIGNTVISCLLVSVFFLFSSNPADAHLIKATIVGNPADYIGYNGITNRIYTVSSGSSTVQVFNSYSGSLSATISTPNPGPTNIAINSNNNKIYSKHFAYGGVTIIDGVTNAATFVATGTNPSGIAVNTVTNKVYVSNSGSNTVSVIDGSTNLVTTNIPVGSNPQSVAIDATRNRIYVANASSGTVSVIDGNNDTVISTPITVGTYPYRLAVNETTNRIYVANNSSNNVSVIDGTALSVTATVTAGTNPETVAVNPSTNMVYVSNMNSTNITVINGATDTAVNLPFHGKFIGINQSINTIYLSGNANLPIIDGATSAVTMIYPPAAPNDIAVNSASNLAYLANSSGITILDSNQYTLTTSTYSPDFGSGTVTANPANTTYPAGTVVTLKATPALGSYFSGWSGDCAGNLSLTCKAIMDGAKTVTANFTTTQPTVTTWSKSIGNPSTDDSFTAVQQTADGGYVMTGSYGYSGGVSKDFWVVKMNSDGSVAWQKSYNGSYDSFGLNGNESASSIQQTADGGYILAGMTQINGGSRGWILRLDSLGNHLWNRPIGADDASFSSFSSAQQTSDGGFIATGSANNNIWLVKLASTGVIEWQKGALSGSGNSVIQTSDDGYIVAGGTLLTKFAADGSATWQSQLSGVTLTSVVQNLDGSYAVAGYSAVASAGGNDVWVAKLDATGSVITWQKSLGGSGNEYGTSLQQTTDGGYIVGGYSDTLGAGAQDILLIKLDATGALQGSQTYGGTSFDNGASVQQTADGGYILVGQTYVGTALYKNDGWAMKLDGTGLMTGCESSAILTPVLTAVDPGITIVQSAISSSNVTNKSAANFSTAPIDTSVAAATAAVCYITSFPIDGKITVVPGNAQVELFWTPATSAAGITSYRVAKGINGFATLTDCSTGVDVGNVTSYLDNTPPLINDQTYYYRVCAVDAFTAVSTGLTAAATPSASLNLLTVTKSGTGAGKVSSIAGNLDCGVVCANNYPAGAVITLTAAPASGSYFNGWSGACAGTSSLTCQVTMAASLNVNVDFTTTAPASVPTWSKVLNSTGFDVAWAVRETADGGAIIAGEKNSAAWVIKLASSGAVQWQNTYGNAGYYRINEIQLTADGGYITAGTGNSASWIMKLAADGTVTWENIYIGIYPGEAYSVQQTADGGYIFTGYLSPGISNIDALVVKLDAAGNVSWDKTYGNSTSGEYAYSIRQTADGGYIVGGKVETSLNIYDAWTMKLFKDGSVDWQKRFNITSYYSQIKSIEPASDGGFIAAGKNNLDAWIVKLDRTGGLKWQHTYNHFGNQGATSVIEATDGSYVFATKGALINVSTDGANMLWQQDYAYINGDDLNSVQATSDGGYIAVGASGGSIDSDIWLLKSGANGFMSGWTRSITSTYSTSAVTPVSTTFTFAPAFLSKSISTTAVTPHYMLTINKSGSGYGLVNSSESLRPEMDCGNICTTVYPANAAVSLNATPFAAATFNGWSDAGCSGTGICSFNITANTVVSAPFTANNTVIVLNEKFDSLTFPAGWTTTATSGSPWSSFASANSPMALNSARGGGGYVSADALSDSVLTSPQLDLSLYGSAALVFKAAGGGGSSYVEYSADNGTTWTAAFTLNGSFTSGTTTQIVDLTPLAGSTTARFQLHFIGGDSQSWVIDDVQLYGVMLPNQPIISVTPTAYNFGTVPVNGNASWPITISNKGTAPLGVTAITIAGADYLLNTAGGITPCNSSTPTIAAGSSCTVTVTVAPLTSGFKSGVVTIASNAANMANQTVSFSAKTTPQNIAYIYDTDTVLRDEFNTFLTGLGYAVSAVQLAAAETYNFSTTDLILIGHDTSGFFSTTNGNDWGTAAAVSNISGSNRPILGLGFGGTSLFGKLGLFINWGNSWNGFDKDITIVNSTTPIFNTPRLVSGYPVSLYSVAPAEIAIYMPTQQTGVTPLGMEFTDTLYHAHYSLIQQSTANQVYTLWGFGGSPATMTTDGQNLFANILFSYAPTPAVTTQNYTITASASPSIGGSITPAGSSSVLSGSSPAFAITPFTGYHIADVTVDGISQGVITAYTFSNVTANHTIAALFAPDNTAATITGTINYTGSNTGLIYISLHTPNGTLGTSIATPGTYTIRGVPNGTYTINAFMDNLNLGTQVQSSPAGSFSANISGSNVAGLDISLFDQTPQAPPAPANVSVAPGDGSVMISWDPPRGANGVEAADSYDIYWGPTATVSSTINSGSKVNIPAGLDSPVVIESLTNGSSLFFSVVPKSGGVTGNASPPIGPVTINPTTGGNTVSGTVTYSGSTPTGPLYVILVDPLTKGINGAYYTKIATPSFSNTFSISGAPNGSYMVYVIIDQNNDGRFGVGDTGLTSYGAPQVTLTGSGASGISITLNEMNTEASITTNHGKPASGTGEWYNVNGEIGNQLKRAVKVALTSAPAYMQLSLPLDLGLGSEGGRFNFWGNATTRPTIGDTFTFLVSYADATPDTTITATVTGVLDSFPAFLQVSSPVTTVPTFTWGAPLTTPPANYLYSLWIGGNNGGNQWEAWDIPASITSMVYGSTGSTPQPLAVSTTYSVAVSVKDLLGNQAQLNTNFTPTQTVATPTYTITALAAPAVGGYISPPGTTQVNSGAGEVYFITPNTGYHIADVKVDGASQGAITSYTFTNVTANHTIDVIFAIDTVDISGTISYTGTNTGRIYIAVETNQGILGTSIAAPGAYTIRGLPNGTFPVRVFMDSLNLGTRVQSSPAGSSTVTISGTSVTHPAIAIIDQPAVAPPAPLGVSASPGDGSVILDWDKDRPNGVESADSYDIYWDTSAAVSSTVYKGKRTGIPAGFDSPAVIDGLTNGDKLYFIAIASSGGLQSGPSIPFGPVTVGTPTGGNSVSGTLTYTGQTPTGPLHIAVVNPMSKGAKGVYYTTIQTPSASNNFTVNGVPDGEYVIYSIIDMNNDKLFGSGDVMTPDNQAPMIQVAGAPLNGIALGLNAMNAESSIRTDHHFSGAVEFFNLEGQIRGQIKRPVMVSVTAAPASSNLALPMDLGLDTKDGSGNFRFWTGTPGRPNVGDSYTFSVTYSDGSTDSALTASVTGVNDSFPTNPQIFTPVTTVPTFSWGAPAAPPANYRYSLWAWTNNNNIWDAWDLPKSMNTIVYGATGNMAQPLQIGLSYNWNISTVDQNGNRASVSNSFVPLQAGTPLIFWQTPPPVNYGTPLSAAQLNATAQVPGTFSYSPSSGALLNAGSQTLTVTFTPTDTANYTIATATVNLTVNQVTPVITWPAPAAILTTTPLSATELSATASVPGTFTYSPAAGTLLSAGSQTLSATFTPTDSVNYTTASASVTITINLPTFSLTATAASGGSITPAGTTSLTSGGSQTYSITPQTGYHVTDVKVDGVSQGAVTTYTFNNVTAGHTIDATFAVDTFTITATANSGGTITPLGATTLNYGASQSYTITPDAGFVLIDVRVDQVSVGKVTSYTFNNLASGHTIEAVFGADGVVDPSNTTGVPQLGDALIVLTAALGDATLTPAQIKKVDTMPISNGVPQPDGKIDLLDVLVMLRRVVGLEKW